jgi:hypothetical protein
MAKKRVTLVHNTGYEESVPADDKVEINQRLARGYRIKDETTRSTSTSESKKSSTSSSDSKKDSK